MPLANVKSKAPPALMICWWSFDSNIRKSGSQKVANVRIGPLVPGEGRIGHAGESLGERKFEHDLSLIVRHLDDGTQQLPAGALASQQFPNHGARDFPGAVRVAQLLALGIADQLIADSGIEKISRHLPSMERQGGNWKRSDPHKFFIRS